MFVSVRLCLLLFVRLYLYLSVFASPVCPSLSVSVRLCLPLSVRLCLPCLSVRLSVSGHFSLSLPLCLFLSVFVRLFVCPSSFILSHSITEVAPISPLLAQETREHTHYVSFYYHDLAQNNGIKSHLRQTCLDPSGDKWASNKSKNSCCSRYTLTRHVKTTKNGDSCHATTEIPEN